MNNGITIESIALSSENDFVAQYSQNIKRKQNHQLGQ